MDIQRLELELARQARRKRQAGMTLIELLATLAIVGSLAGIAVPKYHEIADAARVTQAIGDISAIQTTLDTRDSLPDNLAGIGQSLVDPWGNPYVYVKFPNGSPGWTASAFPSTPPTTSIASARTTRPPARSTRR